MCRACQGFKFPSLLSRGSGVLTDASPMRYVKLTHFFMVKKTLTVTLSNIIKCLHINLSYEDVFLMKTWRKYGTILVYNSIVTKLCQKLRRDR